MKKNALFESPEGKSYLLPFILVVGLFFMWGFAHALLDVLNKHFQDILHITKAKSALVQMSLYGGYFIMALPAGFLLKKHGYKRGIVIGLALFAIGAFLFYPATLIKSFFPFLAALFVIACGLAFLETAANPYATVLGPQKSAAQRINLAQSFNGLGWVLGPLVGGAIIFSEEGDPFAILAKPYMGVGIIVLIMAILFIKVPLPEIISEDSNTQNLGKKSFFSLFRYKLLVFAIIAQFFYVAAQTGIGSFFINYAIDAIPGMKAIEASQMLSIGMVLFMLGRLLASFILKFIKPKNLIALFSAINVLLLIVVMGHFGMISVVCLLATYFFMSILFPTIFAVGISGLKEDTQRASSLIVMSIVGGAVIPILMGYIADISSMAIGFSIPLICFIVTMLFGLCKFKN